MGSLNVFDISTPNCQSAYLLGAIPVNQNCTMEPVFSQVCDLYIQPEGAMAPFLWSGGEASINEESVGNNVTNNTRSKWISGKGGVPAPGETVYQGPKLRDIVAVRRYQLSLKVSVNIDSQRNFLRQLQSNWLEYKFWFATVSGRLFGGENGIMPHFSNALLPLGKGRDDVEEGTIIIEFVVTGPGLPVASNPYYTSPPTEIIPTVIVDGDGAVVIDSDGVTVGYY